MKIKVTADHIARGRRFGPKSCPVALALIDAGFKNPSATYTNEKISQ